MSSSRIARYKAKSPAGDINPGSKQPAAILGLKSQAKHSPVGKQVTPDDKGSSPNRKIPQITNSRSPARDPIPVKSPVIPSRSGSQTGATDNRIIPPSRSSSPSKYGSAKSSGSTQKGASTAQSASSGQKFASISKINAHRTTKILSPVHGNYDDLENVDSAYHPSRSLGNESTATTDPGGQFEYYNSDELPMARSRLDSCIKVSPGSPHLKKRNLQNDGSAANPGSELDRGEQRSDYKVSVNIDPPRIPKVTLDPGSSSTLPVITKDNLKAYNLKGSRIALGSIGDRQNLLSQDCDFSSTSTSMSGSMSTSASHGSTGSTGSIEAAEYSDSCVTSMDSPPNLGVSGSPEDQDLSPINAFDQDSGNETGLEESQVIDHFQNRLIGTEMLDSFHGLMDSFHGTEDSLDYLSAPSEDQGLASSMEGELDDRGIASTIQIYTDWANHYLEKARLKRFITDLQVDICDGVLLADIIYAVTNETVHGVNTKPSDASQMVENISSCLGFLADLGVNVDGLSARDIRDGNLKAILGLFFSLSRFKQQQKSIHTTSSHNHQNHNTSSTTVVNGNSNHTNITGSYSNSRRGSAADNLSTNGNPEMVSRLPSPQKGSSKCPTVNNPNAKGNNSLDRSGTASQRGTSPGTTSNLNKLSKGHYSSLDRGRQQLTCPNNNLIANSGSQGKSSKESTKDSGIPSRSGSPNPRSLPVRGASRSLGPPRSQADKNSNRVTKETSGTSSLGLTRPSSASAGPSSAGNSLPSPRPASATTTSQSTGHKDKSMLDKFKLFKDKGDKNKGSSGKGSKSSSHAPPPTTPTPAPTPEGKSSGPKSPTRTGPPDGAVGGAPPGIPNGTASPKPSAKFGKKALTRNAKKDPLPAPPVQSPPSSLPRDDSSRRASSASSSIPSRTASNTSVSSTASNNTGPKKSSRIPNDKASDSRQGSKIAGVTPTKSKSGSKHGATTPTSSQASTPTGGSGIPKPGAMLSMGRPAKDSTKGRTTPSSSSRSSLSSLQSGRGKGDNSSSTSSIASSVSTGQSGSPQDPKHPGMSLHYQPAPSAQQVNYHPQQGHHQPQGHPQQPQGHPQQQYHHSGGSQGSHPPHNGHYPPNGQPQSGRYTQDPQEQGQGPGVGHGSSSRAHAPKQLAVDSRQNISKSMKVNNTNFSQQDTSPEKISSSMHDKNANIRAAAGATGSMGRREGSSGHSNIKGQKLNNSKSSERLNGSRSSDRLQYNLSPGPQNTSRSASPNMSAIPGGHSSKVQNKMAAAGQQTSQKPQKVDSDTQTAASVIHAAAIKQQYQEQQKQQRHAQQQGHKQGSGAPPQGHQPQGHQHHHQSQSHPSRQKQVQEQGSPLHASSQLQHHQQAQGDLPQVNMPKAHPVLQMGKAQIQPKAQQQMTVGPQNSLHPLLPSPRQSPRSLDRRTGQLTEAAKKSNSSLSSDSTNLSSAGEDSNLSSNSTSNSNNSASSTDSVIYRPSSCDELESGADSDSNYGTPTKNAQSSPVVQDHISSLRQQKREKESPQRTSTPKKMETTFEAEVTTEERVSSKPPIKPGKETTLGTGEEMDAFDVDIKPMQPLMRSTPYAYLRNLPLLRPSLHIPTLSNQNCSLAGSASSRLGVNRPLIDHAKLYTHSMKRNMSHSMDTDYGSDIEGFDVQAGYMSDGDILRSSHSDDINSGYMSEGGASLYAKRMQQRFREGIMAVKECMQKSSGMADDDSFDDSSSISSGDISDTINEISTDDNITTGSSLSGTSSERTNPYGSLKRVPTGGVPNNVTSRSLPSRTGNLLYPKANALLTRNLNVHGRDNLDNILGENWKKYCISEDGSASSGQADHKQYPVGIPGAMFIKKKSNQAVITDLRSKSLRNPQGGVAVAVEDPHLEQSGGEAQANGKQKRDSETNTDHSVMMMRRPGSRQGSTGAPPISAGFGFRRPLSTSSNASNSSTGSRGSSRMSDAEALKGERLSNYNKGGMVIGRQGASQSKGSPMGKDSTDMGPESYSASTLERKKRANLVSSKTQTNITTTATSPHSDYQSNTLGRKRGGEPNLKDRMFGSRNSLNKVSQQQDVHMFNSTIISNPHATFGKDGHPIRSGDISPGQGHNYVNINYLSPDGMPPRPLSGLSSPGNGYSWPKSNGSMMGNGMRMALSETESMESLSSASSSIQAQIQQARASAMASRNILQGLNTNHMGLHRSDSFKSTKSEKVFPTSHPDTSHLQRTNSFTQLCAENPGYPLSSLVATTTPSGLGSLSRPSSTASSSSPYANVFLPLSKLSSSKDDDLHGSSLSLVSSSSSVYSTADEKHNHEVRKLRRELEQAQEKVSTLTNQLTTNAHVVSAFEQSLSNMTHRLQNLSCTAEAKDSELAELRATIESLKQQSGITFSPDLSFSPSSVRRQSSNASGLSLKEPTTPGSESTKGLTRHRSTDSVSSLNSMSSACSAASQQSSMTDAEKEKKKKKKNWLRSSFSKAFSRKPPKNGKCGSLSDAELDCQSIRSDASVPNSPLLHVPHPMSMPTTPIKTSNSSSMLSDGLVRDDAVLDLQQKLHEKDMKLTEIRLESLSSVHQLEQLREAMNRMKNEMVSLKQDNDRLHRMVSSQGMSPTSPQAESLEKRLSLGDPSSLDLMLSESPDRDGRRITLSVYLNGVSDFCKPSEGKLSEVLIGAISVSGKTKWDMLDSAVKRAFKEYILRIDPVTNLGLNGDSVSCYNIGDLVRNKGGEIPELLPCGYLVGENTNISITLKGNCQSSVDNLSFEALIPKSIVQRYISLLLEHKRIILCGPSGTGKTFLAQKLAEYLVLKSGKELTAGSIATFNVDHKSSKELRQYLANIADQCDSAAASELPNVIILDNLHHVSSLGEVFNGFLSVKHRQCPYIIGTMHQTTCSTTNLQLHHNFRWVLCANHMEPVKGFLGRFLRRKLVQEELKVGARNGDLSKIIDWVPKVWQHLNKFLETHSSSDVTIGPRLFLSCPMDAHDAQVWFTDLWNYSIVPYLLEAVREGIQLYGKRAPWEDPADWVIETYPWTNRGSSEWPTLLHLRPEDVGYDTQGAPTSSTPKAVQNPAQSDVEGDPLMNMLMRLQEAASYSSPQSNDSDSTSMDSHGSAQDCVPPTAVSTASPAPNTVTTNSSIESTI